MKYICRESNKKFEFKLKYNLIDLYRSNSLLLGIIVIQNSIYITNNFIIDKDDRCESFTISIKQFLRSFF